MNEPTIKPGTRCECRDPMCPQAQPQHHYKGGPAVRSSSSKCFKPAVRTVPVERVIYREPEREAVTAESVPMCAACAKWHEGKAGMR